MRGLGSPAWIRSVLQPVGFVGHGAALSGGLVLAAGELTGPRRSLPGPPHGDIRRLRGDPRGVIPQPEQRLLYRTPLPPATAKCRPPPAEILPGSAAVSVQGAVRPGFARQGPPRAPAVIPKQGSARLRRGCRHRRAEAGGISGLRLGWFALARLQAQRTRVAGGTLRLPGRIAPPSSSAWPIPTLKTRLHGGRPLGWGCALQVPAPGESRLVLATATLGGCRCSGSIRQTGQAGCPCGSDPP